MQRPISVVCMVFVLTILLFYEANPAIPTDMEGWDGKRIVVTGKVLEKERKGQVLSLLVEVRQVRAEAENLSNQKLDINKLFVEYEVPQSKDYGERENQEPQSKDYCGRENQEPQSKSFGGREYEEPHIGETVQFKGILDVFERARNPGEFDAAFHYYSEGIFGKLTDATFVARSNEKGYLKELLFDIRQELADSLTACVDERYSGILKAMLLGMKSEMNTEVKELFYATGIGHILAISGLHISTIGRGIYGILKRIGVSARLGGAISIILMLLYGEMTGMSHSAYRAIIMFILALVAEIMGRTYDSLIALSISAVIILLENPLYLYQSGFLLSFCAVLGTAIPAPAFRRLFLTGNRKFLHRSKKAYIKEKIISSLIIPVSIQLFTIPIQMYFFYEISVYSMLINLLVLPLMTAVLLSGLVGMCLGVLSIAIGNIAVFPAELIMSLYEKLCSAAIDIPGAVFITGKPTETRLVFYYLIVTLVSIVAFKAFKHFRYDPVKWKKTTVKSAFLLGIVMSCFILFLPDKRENQILILDVGQGDGICILTESDNCILIDGGSTSRSKVAEHVLIPALKYYGVREIDYSIITHSDKDHYSGIVEILEQGKSAEIRIRKLVLPYILRHEDKVVEICNLAKAAGTEVIWLSRGDVLTESGMLAEFGQPVGESVVEVKETLAGEGMPESEGVTIYCVHPGKEYEYESVNDASLGLYVKCGAFSALLMGDIEENGSNEVIEYMRIRWNLEVEDCDVLKVAHHGSRDSTPQEFVEILNPRVAIISCGEGNIYGHPHEETLERLDAVRSKIMTTAVCGAIVVEAGQEMEVRSWGSPTK